MSFFTDVGQFATGAPEGLASGLVFGVSKASDRQGAKLADAQVKAARNAQELQRSLFNRLRQDAKPVRGLRDDSLRQVNRLFLSPNRDMGSFMASPEFNNVLAASTQVADGQSDNVRNALLRRGGNLALGEFNNFSNRLLTQGGIGAEGLNTTNSQLQANIDRQAELLNDAGAAAASGIIGSANAKRQTATGIAGALGSIFSDRRLKEDIRKVGETDSGLNVYTYRYKGQAKVHMGVMAQEVEKVYPDAVTEVEGVKMVDYRRIA